MAAAEFQPVTILRATASVDLADLNVKRGDKVYLARDGRSSNFRVVRWERTRWVCSCGQGACEHKLAVNSFVFEESQAQRPS